MPRQVLSKVDTERLVAAVHILLEPTGFFSLRPVAEQRFVMALGAVHVPAFSSHWAMRWAMVKACRHLPPACLVARQSDPMCKSVKRAYWLPKLHERLAPHAVPGCLRGMITARILWMRTHQTPGCHQPGAHVQACWKLGEKAADMLPLSLPVQLMSPAR